MPSLDLSPYFCTPFISKARSKSSKSSAAAASLPSLSVTAHDTPSVSSSPTSDSDETASNSTPASSPKRPSFASRLRHISSLPILRSRNASQPHHSPYPTPVSLESLTASFSQSSLLSVEPMYAQSKNSSSRSLNRVSMTLNDILNHQGMNTPHQYVPPPAARPLSILSISDDGFVFTDGIVMPMDTLKIVKSQDEVILRIAILAARDLVPRERDEPSDPYAVIRVDNKKYQTVVLRETLNPAWDFKVDLRVTPSNCPRLLTITVWDEVALGRVYLGELNIPIANIFDRNAGDRFLGSPRAFDDPLNEAAWFSLQRRRKSPRDVSGEVLCKFGFVERSGPRSEDEWRIRWRMITQRVR